MDKVKKIGKGGWHPEGRESWRGDFKGINKVVCYTSGMRNSGETLKLLNL